MNVSTNVSPKAYGSPLLHLVKDTSFLSSLLLGWGSDDLVVGH